MTAVPATITLPPTPREVPALEAEPGGVRAYATDLLAASAQLDDLGSFVAGAARTDDWTGVAATAYRAAARPVGSRADARSLALRAVARRVDAHADALDRLLARRLGLVEERADLTATIGVLAARARGASVEDAAAVQAACDDCTRRVRAYEADLDRLLTDLVAEEEEMRAAFDRVRSAEEAQRRHGGRADPADAALDAMPPAGADPAEVRAWWDGLTRAEQEAVVAAAPGAVGNRDGLPTAVRDEANRLAIERDLEAWGLLEERGLLTGREERWLENARAARSAVQTIESGLDPWTFEPVTASVHLYDPAAFDGDGAVAVAAGDPDTADNVAVVVPGLGTDAESAPYQAERALTLYEAARFLDGSETNASMFWIGYDAPDNAPWDEGWDAGGVVAEDLATAGGERLADTLDGLRAAREGEPAHLTAIGHSYGSTTLGHAAHDHGVPVDDLVLVGSPGAGGETDHARDTGVDPEHVWAGANSRDPVADLANHGIVHLETFGGLGLGDDPAEDDFGAQRFRAESTTRADHAGVLGLGDHSKYFDHDTESLHNIGLIVNGDHEAVLRADPVHDPWFGPPEDPEWDREPTSPQTRGSGG